MSQLVDVLELFFEQLALFYLKNALYIVNYAVFAVRKDNFTQVACIHLIDEWLFMLHINMLTRTIFSNWSHERQTSFSRIPPCWFLLYQPMHCWSGIGFEANILLFKCWNMISFITLKFDNKITMIKVEVRASKEL